jgi:hypothetical protein
MGLAIRKPIGVVFIAFWPKREEFELKYLIIGWSSICGRAFLAFLVLKILAPRLIEEAYIIGPLIVPSCARRLI